MHDVQQTFARAFEGGDSLTAEAIATLASPRIVKRGLAYARAGRVSRLAVGDRRLEAIVEGSAAEPYHVTLAWDGEELSSRCSCPFDWEPFCKHGLAALFAWSLPAVRDHQVVDEAYEAKVAESLEERQERSLDEELRVTSLDGDRFFGAFAVASPSGKTYVVEIRSLAERLNRCDCLDYETSMLGTCKHIEAVLGRIFSKAPRKARQLAEAPAETARVMVSREDTPAIVARLPARPSRAVAELFAECFDAAGRLKIDAGLGFQGFVARARRLRNVVIHSDALDLSDEVLRGRRFEQRAAEVRAEVLRGGGRIPGLTATLYPFQVEGAAFLAAAGRALLADDMGLGKTVQAIAALAYLRHRGEVDRALIVCPASLKHQWRAELKRFSGVDAEIVERGPAHRQALFRSRPPVLITSYELVRRDLDHITAYGADLLVLDEAQRIKNWRTTTADSVKSVRTPFAFVLTGTPVENRLEDLYSLMQVVDRKVLGPLWQFEAHFVERDEKGKVRGYRRLTELRRRLRPAVLRRVKREVLTQLPGRLDNRFDVEMTKDQREYMLEAEQKAARLVALSEKRPLKPEELELLMKHMQAARMACNAAGLVDKHTVGSPKLEELGHLLHQVCVEGERKAVVFSEWVTFQAMAVAEARRLKIDHVVLNGSVPVRKRGALIERFMTDPECRVFFSTDSGGVGLNLQAADTVINLDLPWNPAVLEQRIGRVHRQGQRNAVNVLLVVASNSFESNLWAMLEGKRAVFEAAVDFTSDADWVASPSSCLQVARELYRTRRPEALAALAETSPGSLELVTPPGPAPASQVAATTTSTTTSTTTTASTSDEAAGPGGEARACAERLGHRLERVLRLATGQVVAVVDRVDDVTRGAADDLGMVPLSREVVDAMAALGAAAPTAGAEVLLDHAADPGALAAGRRREQVGVARRKLQAASSLSDAGLHAEALEHAFGAMLQAARSLAPDGVNGAGEVPARLLWEVLVPRQLLSLEQAGLVQRAEALARAYGSSAAPVPRELVAAVLTDAHGLVEHVAAQA